MTMRSFLKRLFAKKLLRLSAGGAIVGPDGRIVIVRQHDNSWSLPKGGVEEGESLIEAARREIYEETGITDLVLIEELGTYDRYSIGRDGTGEDHSLPMGRRTFFLFHTKETAFTPTDGEITEARWVTVDEALSLLTHPRDVEFLASVRGRIR
jgi:8-oxo-dGTP pyrophosphatase MutT (NUDIX family)